MTITKRQRKPIVKDVSKTKPSARTDQARLDAFFERFAGKAEPILLSPTGGTIEYVWDTEIDGLAYPADSSLPGYLKKLQLHLEFEVRQLFELKESGEITYEDKKAVLKLIRETPLQRILIPMGLFAIPDVSAFIRDELEDTDKTVVFYGSRAPLDWKNSDGPLVTGFSIGAVLALGPGVYASIDGRLFGANEVRINELGELEKTPVDASQRLDRLFQSLSATRKIHIADTGGTIGSLWDPTVDTAIVSETPLISRYLTALKSLDLEFVHTDVCRKDSRALTYEDTKALKDAVLGSEQQSITVPIGTYKMIDTAKYVQDQMDGDPERAEGKTVVFYGSMIPLMGYLPSDAAFNIGFGTAASLVLPPGVYVVMNGRAFSVNEVKKNLGAGRFEASMEEQ